MLDRFDSFLGSYASEAAGEGICPTGVEVRYVERFELRRIQDWVRYDQRAVHATSGVVLHTESGIFREADDGSLVFSAVMNSGRLEVGVARWEGALLRTQSREFFNDRLGVRANERRFHFDEGSCDKELWLSVKNWPVSTRHMWGRLRRDTE